MGPCIQKLQERQATFNISAISGKEKEKWMKIFVPEMISSEESDDDNEDTVVIKPLGWRSQKVFLSLCTD
jgi:hypothetical protein